MSLPLRTKETQINKNKSRKGILRGVGQLNRLLCVKSSIVPGTLFIKGHAVQDSTGIIAILARINQLTEEQDSRDVLSIHYKLTSLGFFFVLRVNHHEMSTHLRKLLGVGKFRLQGCKMK